MRQMLDAELASIVGAKHAKLARDLTGLDVTVLMIDGLNVADQMIVVAMVICADGTKIPIGLKLATPRTPSWSKTSSPTSSPAGGGQPFVAPKVRYPG